MNIMFTKFEKGENWVAGLVNNDEFYFEAKLFDGGSVFGIGGGRVSKLNISIGDRWSGFDNCIVNYDRGWDIDPEPEYALIFERILEFLETAPTDRFE